MYPLKANFTANVEIYLSNKNIIRAKCIVEKFVRQEITDLTLDIKWEYYLQIPMQHNPQLIRNRYFEKLK